MHRPGGLVEVLGADSSQVMQVGWLPLWSDRRRQEYLQNILKATLYRLEAVREQ